MTFDQEFYDPVQIRDRARAPEPDGPAFSEGLISMANRLRIQFEAGLNQQPTSKLYTRYSGSDELASRRVTVTPERTDDA